MEAKISTVMERGMVNLRGKVGDEGDMVGADWGRRRGVSSRKVL